MTGVFGVSKILVNHNIIIRYKRVAQLMKDLAHPCAKSTRNFATAIVPRPSPSLALRSLRELRTSSQVTRRQHKAYFTSLRKIGLRPIYSELLKYALPSADYSASASPIHASQRKQCRFQRNAMVPIKLCMWRCRFQSNVMVPI